MYSLKGSVILILAILTGYTQAGTPSVTGKSDGDYRPIPENFNGTVFRIHVQDPDNNDNINVVADDETTREYFNIILDKNGGHSNDVWVNVTVKKALDRETLHGSVKVLLRITDNQQNVIRYTFTVYINDINDNIPVFQHLPYNLDLYELPCNKTEVYTSILATDKDSNANGRITYSMMPNAQSVESQQLYDRTFSIDSTTGHVTLDSCLDYENNSYYQFTVTAKDSGPNGGLSATAEFIIRVQDVPDKPPFFTGIPYRKTIKEDFKVGSNILQLNAVDGDPGVTNSVNYTIIYSSCGAGLFQIDTSTGHISTSSNIDRDSGLVRDMSGNCILTVVAEEIGRPGERQYGNTTTSTNVTMLIKDIDDNMPTFGASFYSASVPKNTPKDVQLQLDRTITVSDLDTGDNALMEITLRNYDNTECQDFVAYPSKIQGSGIVMIYVKNSSLLKYEQRRTKIVKVIATEKANASNIAEAEIRINILDVLDWNANTLKFNRTSFALTVKENSANGTFVGRITATDANKRPGYKIVYSIQEWTNRFVVDPNTGDILTNCSVCSIELDREDREEYNMIYNAKGEDWSSASTAVKIKIIDVNDETPTFLKPLYIAYMKENTAETFVTQVWADDKDEPGSNNSEIVYSVVNTTEPGFTNNLTIDSITGKINVKYPLDYEKVGNPSGVINITVEANDMGNPTLSCTTLVSIIVQDMNDNVPVFSQTEYNTHVWENATSDIYQYTNIAQVQAIDGDGTSVNNIVSYIIASGAMDHFIIDPSSGVVSIVPYTVLDRESIPSYNLTILAVDKGAPPISSTTTLSIDISDVNDVSPVFGSKVYTAMITENTNAAGTIIANCIALDPDLDASLEYSIVKLEAFDGHGLELNGFRIADNFQIDMGNGSVYVSKRIDNRIVKVAKITLQVLDTSADSFSQTDDSMLFVTLMDTTDYQSSTTSSHIVTKYSTPISTTPHLSSSQSWNFENPCNKDGFQSGYSKFPHPASENQLLICDFTGDTYLAYCPPGEIFHANCSVCAKPRQYYSASCVETSPGFVNPCTKENIIAGNLTFPHPDSSTKYIRCDTSGTAWVEECFSGSVWDQKKLICVLPMAYNPCHQRGSLVQSLYPHYCDPRLYIQCDNSGQPFVHTCQKNYVFLTWDLTCVPPAFPGSEYLRYTCQ